MSADAKRPGWWTCLICKPNVHDKGGQREFYSHYNRVHYLASKATS